MASPTLRSGPDPQAQGGVLPLPHDALYEILLRLSAKDLCRLRAVCRPWRCLLSDPHFIAAHAARHPAPPLVVAGYHTAYRNDGVVCDILDLSGNGVKRVRATGDAWVTSTHHDFICTSKGTSSCIRLLNLTTGAVLALPEELAEEHAGTSGISPITFLWPRSDGLPPQGSTSCFVCLIVLPSTNQSSCVRSSPLMAAAMLGGGERRPLQILCRWAAGKVRL
uniref:F-box domain-containing protein n=1 Tax=Arundo donax TaxID=35708 RepID=A0A0A9F1T5_ARUDO